MLKYEEYDQGFDVIGDYKLPSVISAIRVSHDGGRLKIEINDEQVFYSTEGTRDCSVLIDHESRPPVLEDGQLFSMDSAPRDGTVITVVVMKEGYDPGFLPDGYGNVLFKDGFWVWANLDAEKNVASPVPIGWKPIASLALS